MLLACFQPPKRKAAPESAYVGYPEQSSSLASCKIAAPEAASHQKALSPSRAAAHPVNPLPTCPLWGGGCCPAQLYSAASITLAGGWVAARVFLVPQASHSRQCLGGLPFRWQAAHASSNSVIHQVGCLPSGRRQASAQNIPQLPAQVLQIQETMCAVYKACSFAAGAHHLPPTGHPLQPHHHLHLP